MQSLRNIFWLGTKELRSFAHDWVLLALVIYSFSLAVLAQGQSSSQELHNASVGIVDEDNSVLSREVVQSFLPPYFKPPQPVSIRASRRTEACSSLKRIRISDPRLA